jgi:hypothetical protein
MSENETNATASTAKPTLTFSPTEADTKLLPHPVYEDVYDDDPRHGFIEDIKERGVLSPVQVVPQSRYDVGVRSDEYVIISGHLRVKAAIQANRDVEVRVKDSFDSEDEETQAVIRLNQDGRNPNNLTTIKEAAKLHSSLEDRAGNTNKQVSAALSGRDVSHQWVHEGLYIWWRRPGGKKSDQVPEGTREHAARLLEAISNGKGVGTAQGLLKDDIENKRHSSNQNKTGSSNTNDDDKEDDDDDSNERESGEFNNTPLSARSLLPEGEVRKTPVVGPEFLQAAQNYWVNNQNAQIDDKPLDWWTVEGIVDPYHPHVLLNPITVSSGLRNNVQKQEPAWRVLRLDRDEHFVIADSGGFQLQSRDDVDDVGTSNMKSIRNGTIAPDSILQWQMKNADAGMSLDIAPSVVDKDEYSDAFRVGLRKTKRYAETAITERRTVNPDSDWRTQHPDDFLLYGAIHGKPNALSGKAYESYKQWYETLTDDLDFDGWAFGELGGLSDIALCLAFAGEYIEADRIHLLGAKGLHQRVLMRYFTELYPETTVTHDTSRGSRRGAKLRRLKSSLQYDAEYRHGDGDNHTAYETMPCGCSICERVEADVGGQAFAEHGGSIYGSIPTLHNHQMQQLRLHEVDAYVEEQGRTLLDQFADNDVSTVVGISDRKLPELDLVGSLWTHLDTNPQARGKLRELYYALRFLTEAHDDGLDPACERWQFEPRFKRIELRQSVIQPSESTRENPFA